MCSGEKGWGRGEMDWSKFMLGRDKRRTDKKNDYNTNHYSLPNLTCHYYSYIIIITQS